MRLRVQIILLVMLPLLALGGVTYTIGSQKITEVMSDTIEQGLEGVAIATRDAFTVGMEGDFRVDENGDMWKGNAVNISQSEDIADDVKASTGIEITVFFGDTRYMTSVINKEGERVLGTKASGTVVEKVLNNGERYFAENVDVAGEDFFAFYIPIYNDGAEKPAGMVFAGMSQENAEEEINSIIHLLLLIILCTIAIVVVISWIIANGIVKGVKSGVNAIEQVADGNLTVEIESRYLKRKDEIGEMTSAVAKLKVKMVSLIGQIADKSRQVYEQSLLLNEKSGSTAEMVEQVEKAVNDIAAGAGSQAEETQSATENIVLMGSMVEQTNKEVGALAENSGQIKEASNTAAAALTELNDINSRVTDAVDVIYRQTNTTNESALKIKEAIDIITSIAEETNLLSLNATIEAARAGEMGRGFAVVAEQIQKLAEQSDDSARQIEKIVNSLIHDSGEAVTTMNEIQQIMKTQNMKVNQTDESFGYVKDGVEQSIISIRAIEEQTKGLDNARIKVIDGVQNLTAIAQENAASAQETSASVMQVSSIVVNISESAGELKTIADELKQSIELFKL